MNCVDLARTGIDLAWVGVLVAALALVALGLAFRRGRGGERALAVILIVCVAGFWAAAPTPPARAACAPPANSLTIAQTSVIVGLSPTQQSALISGWVTNNGPDETFVTAIVASIGSVAKAAGAAPGVCDASDYILTNPRMPVGQQLAANGGSMAFSGARIGFVNKFTNQDACQGAVVELLYVAE